MRRLTVFLPSATGITMLHARCGDCRHGVVVPTPHATADRLELECASLALPVLPDWGCRDYAPRTAASPVDWREDVPA